MEKGELLQQLNSFMDTIEKQCQLTIKFAYLFGSYATDRNNYESDIDLAIMPEKKYNSKEEMLIRGKIIDLGMKYFNKRLDIVFLNNVTPLLKYEIVKSGVVLSDGVARASFESLAFREYFDFRHYAEIYNASIINALKHQAKV